MSEATPESKSRPAPAWNLAANPIFRRYCKSQLRPVSTGFWIVTVLIFVTFFFLLAYIGAGKQWDDPAIQARAAIIPVIIIQGILLMVFGNGATTLAYVREAEEGIASYQRLTPMKPLAKVLGYLFGPPIRCYLLILLTLPFTIFGVVKGNIPLNDILQVASIFFVSGILYHLIGLFAATVIKRRLLAGIVSMGIVFLITIIMPLIIAKSGYQFFTHFTIWPVLNQHKSELIVESLLSQNPEFSEKDVKDAEWKDFRRRRGEWQFFQYQKHKILSETQGEIQFFQSKIPTFAFSFTVQCFLVFTFGVIIYRRWKSGTAHLLSKNFCLFVFGGILVLFLGTSLPLIESGQIFPSINTQFGRNYMASTATQATVTEGMGLSAACGFVTLLIANMLIQTITPSRDGYIKGLRRADKIGRRNPKVGSDEGTSLWHTIIIALLGAAAWYWFTNTLFESSAYPEKSLPSHAFPIMAAVFLFAAICFSTTLQVFGKGVLWMSILFLWIVPLLASGICFISEGIVAGIYLTSPSAFASFFNSLTYLLDGPDLENLKHIKNAFWIWIALHGFLTAILLAVSQSRQAQLRQLVFNESKDND
ncbi:MAG: hypothetical protein ACKVJU_00680 [Verrucomicrobiales bacterium]